MSESPTPPSSDDEPSFGLASGNRRWATTGLVLVNLAFGVVMAWAGVPVLLATAADVIGFGAVDPPRVWSGEVWRLFTACFVHVGAWHLGLNLWVLWQVGRALERLVGPARVVLVYVASGIFGFALSIALLPGLTAGASGAIFGVVGALLALAALTRQQQLGRFLLGALLPFVLATFALGALVPMVNNVAHFGGLLMGFLLGFGLSAGDRSFLVAGAGVDDDTAKAAALATVSSAERVAGMIALVVSVVGFAATTAYALEPRLSPRFHAVMGLRAAHDASVAHADALKGAPLAAARAHAEAAAALAPDDGTTGALVARLAALDGHDDVARARMGRAFRTWLPESGDRNAAFEAAATELALLEPDDEMPFADGFTTRLLCDAALDDDGVNQPSHNLLNSCAWLLLRARERPVRDPVAALPLARAAWETSKKERAEIVHTYACALADNGAAAEGLALLEQLSLADHGAALAPAFLARERARLARLADEQARARRPAADAATPSSPAASQTPDLPALPALPGGDAAEGCAIDHDCADAAVDDPATAPSPTTTAPTTTAPTTAPTTTAPTTTAPTTTAPTTTAPTTTAPTTTAPTTTAPTTAPTGSESRSSERKR